MADQASEVLDSLEDLASDPVEVPREQSEFEKRLRRDLARAREQTRIATSEREAGVAAAARERDEAVAMIRSQANDRVIRSELRAHAMKAGIIDLDGLRLADLTKLSLSEDGDVVGAEALIDSLRQDKPYLFSESRSGIATGTTAQTQRPPAPAVPMALDARTLSREAWQAERDKLLGTSL